MHLPLELLGVDGTIEVLTYLILEQKVRCFIIVICDNILLNALNRFHLSALASVLCLKMNECQTKDKPLLKAAMF